MLKKREKIKTPEKCFFCEEAKTPDYKDYKTLKKCLSDRAKILSAARTGVCSKHQRGLSKEIKRARKLGLLPFTQSI